MLAKQSTSTALKALPKSTDKVFKDSYIFEFLDLPITHQERNKVKSAYNHAEYLAERRMMMSEWVDYLDGLKKGN